MDQVMVSKLNKFFVHFDKFPKFGSLSVLSHRDVNNGDDVDLDPSDIVIYYDYNNEECTEEEADALFEWLFGHEKQTILETIELYMRHYGYKLFDEQDGSGNGLYYGTLHFRKA